MLAHLLTTLQDGLKSVNDNNERLASAIATLQGCAATSQPMAAKELSKKRESRSRAPRGGMASFSLL